MNFHVKRTRGFTRENLAFCWLATTEIILNFKKLFIIFITRTSYTFRYAEIQGRSNKGVVSNQLVRSGNIIISPTILRRLQRDSQVRFYFVQALKIIFYNIFLSQDLSSCLNTPAFSSSRSQYVPKVSDLRCLSTLFLGMCALATFKHFFATLNSLRSS